MENVNETLIYLTRIPNEALLALWDLVRNTDEERTPEGDAIVHGMFIELKVRGLDHTQGR